MNLLSLRYQLTRDRPEEYLTEVRDGVAICRFPNNSMFSFCEEDFPDHFERFCFFAGILPFSKLQHHLAMEVALGVYETLKMRK
jgi:hypothetical protein